uniref:Uncharacterized protein n=1 Tax=Glossina brevipalpis TaxID=37001 RepID=A0A1A9WDD6_9MUSC
MYSMCIVLHLHTIQVDGLVIPFNLEIFEGQSLLNIVTGRKLGSSKNLAHLELNKWKLLSQFKASAFKSVCIENDAIHVREISFDLNNLCNIRSVTKSFYNISHRHCTVIPVASVKPSVVQRVWFKTEYNHYSPMWFLSLDVISISERIDLCHVMRTIKIMFILAENGILMTIGKVFLYGWAIFICLIR